MNAIKSVLAAGLLSIGTLAFAQTPADLSLLGDSAPVTAATRTIVLTPSTTFVNVTGGETIKFIVGEKSFAWNFDGPVSSFDLKRVAPANMLEQTLKVYVAPNPTYFP
ncbi:CzcE family metal-binding protein [Undibacterium sp. SXout7W]|uniref:CzcE family metal-binding protein n=1 Tax=Undibacterium sp. SXout7W TaxID=3413049 RepID=UPI003BF17BB4